MTEPFNAVYLNDIAFLVTAIRNTWKSV